MDDYRYEALKTLTRARFYAVQNLAREKQRFANYLFQKYSKLAQNPDFKNTSATMLNLVTDYESIDDLANTPLEELTAYIEKSGHGRFSDPEAVAKAIQSAARDSCCLPKTINDSVYADLYSRHRSCLFRRHHCRDW